MENHSFIPKRASRVFRAALSVAKLFAAITKYMALIGMSALILAIIVVIADIIWRRVGGRSFIGAVDLTQFSVVAAASWSIPYAFSQKSHVTVDVLSGFFSKTFSKHLDTIAAASGALLSAFLFWLTYQRAAEIHLYGDVSQDLALPMIIPWTFVAVGFLVSTIVCISRALVLLLSKEAQQ